MVRASAAKSFPSFLNLLILDSVAKELSPLVTSLFILSFKTPKPSCSAFNCLIVKTRVKSLSSRILSVTSLRFLKVLNTLLPKSPELPKSSTILDNC